jgi:hypothetical protein
MRYRVVWMTKRSAPIGAGKSASCGWRPNEKAYPAMNQQEIRAEMAAMTDVEVLAWARRRYNPWMNLDTAKEMRRSAFKWMHSTAAAMVRKHGRGEKAMRALRAEILGE